MQLFIT